MSIRTLILAAVLLILINSTVFAAYNQKGVRQYKEDMQKVQSANKSYTLKIKQSIETEGNGLVLYHKAYMKAGKWKALSSSDGGQTYPSVMLFDGKNSYMYWEGMGYGLKIPDLEGLKNSKLTGGNPVDPLFSWDANGTLFDINKAKIINNNVRKNGFDCRLIQFDNLSQACINDKLGIAVYYKVQTKEPLTGMSQTNIINVLNVSTADIPDKVFSVPNEINITKFGF